MVALKPSTASALREVRVVVPGDPVPWARAGRGLGRTFTPDRQRAYGARARACMALAMRGAAPLVGPLFLEVVAVWSRPRDLRGVERVWRPARPDWDNAGKLLSDVANEILWADDAQVVDGRVLKVYAAANETAHVEIVVRELGGS
jgi:Holliday junction resolvase RusA-like endonuclease